MWQAKNSAYGTMLRGEMEPQLVPSRQGQPLLQGETKMRQKLCVVLGIALLAFVGIAMSGVFEPGDPGLVKVGSGEAQLVLGGGQKGNNYVDQHCKGANNCTAYGSISTGPLESGGSWAAATATCGGSCGNIVTKLKDPPE